MDKKKSVRYVNIILKSKLCPVGKGNVMEQSKTKPLYFIRELIKNMENGDEYVDAMIKTSNKFQFTYDASNSEPK